MKKKLILHIGMNKTGSSSIQETLYRNNIINYRYFQLGSSNHGGIIQLLFIKNFVNSNKNRLLLSQEEIDRRIINIKKKLLKEIQMEIYQNYILSAEILIALTIEELESIKEFFSPYFESIDIVGYIRPPKAFSESFFQQELKSGLGQKTPRNIGCVYQERVEKFDKVFGQKQVHLWKFDSSIFPQGNVVLDFCKRLNIDMKKEKTIRVNESLSKESISLLYVYRKYIENIEKGKQKSKENLFFIDLLRKVGSSKYKVSPKFIEPMLKENASDIAWMEERLGESLDESMESTPYDINDEKDLEEFAKESVHLILDMIDDKYLEKPIDMKSPQGVSKIVHALRLTAKDKYNSSLKSDKQDIAKNTLFAIYRKSQEKLKIIVNFLKSKMIKQN